MILAAYARLSPAVDACPASFISVRINVDLLPDSPQTWPLILAYIQTRSRERRARSCWTCSKAYVRLIKHQKYFDTSTKTQQVRGKKNLVIEKSLAGPIGIFVKFSTLQEHGVDKVFFLENDNVDASQKNIIFLARGDKITQPIAIAGTYVLQNLIHITAVLFMRQKTLEIHQISIHIP